MSREVSRNFFVALGASFGLFVGFLVGTLTSLNSMMDIWFNYKIWTLIVIAYFLIQFTLGVLLRKPWVSRNVYLGILSIPVGYLLSNLGSFVFYILVPLILLLEIISLLICLTCYSVIYSVVRLFTGFDAGGLLSPDFSSDFFGYSIDHPKARIVERVLEGTGFQIIDSRSSTDNNSVHLLCEKKKLDLGVYCEQRKDAMQVTFAFFKIENDIVRKVDRDMVLDFKAQVKGMLDDWATRQIIVQYEESPPDIEKTVRHITTDVGPIKVTVPTRLEVWKMLVSYPKNHPYIFSLFTTVLVIVVNIILFMLGKR